MADLVGVELIKIKIGGGPSFLGHPVTFIYKINFFLAVAIAFLHKIKVVRRGRFSGGRADQN